jgi:Uncharacterized protein conserved in bacteria
MQEKNTEGLKKGKKTVLKLGMTGIIVTCIIGTTCSFAFAKEVTVKIGDTEKVLSGRIFENVGDVLEDNGIELTDDYTVSVDTGTALFAVDSIEVKAKATGNLLVDGESIAYQTDAQTVGDLLEENNIQLGELDRVEPGKSTALQDISQVKVIRVKISELPSRQAIAYTTEKKDNPDLEVGKTKVVQVGVDGASSQVERVLYENGVEVKREVISEEIVKQPVKEIIEVGTKETAVATTPVVETPATETPAVTAPVVETPAVTATPAVQTPVATTPAAQTSAVETTTTIPEGAVQTILNCTAYTATGNATASGVMPTANHTVAAWSGLPFGTKIYIPSMGITYTVEDRGGAVTEGIVDIYMDTYDQCIQFGRQNLEAYITYP